MKKFALLISLLISLSQVVQAQEYGLASFYSDKFQGRPTASGEAYDKDKLTAAHKTHPYGTYLRVTRLDNKKSVVVRVNDRGPYISGRVVDISMKAALQLGLPSDGTARVKVEVVQAAGQEQEEANQPVVETQPKPAETPPVATAPAREEKPKEIVKEKPKEPVKETKPVEKAQEKPKTTAPAATAPTSSGGTSVDGAVLVTPKNYQSYDLYKIELYKPEKVGFAVQVASLSTYDNAMKQVADLQGKWLKNVLLSIERGPQGTAVYKILMGPFPDKEQAEAYRKNLKKRFKMNGFVVDLASISY